MWHGLRSEDIRLAGIELSLDPFDNPTYEKTTKPLLVEREQSGESQKPMEAKT